MIQYTLPCNALTIDVTIEAQDDGTYSLTLTHPKLGRVTGTGLATIDEAQAVAELHVGLQAAVEVMFYTLLAALTQADAPVASTDRAWN
jgi:hypothetical protein